MNHIERETVELTLILVIIILVITTFFFVFKTIELMYYNDDALVNKILDKEWYQYSEENTYENFKISSDRTIENNDGLFNNCSLLIYSVKDNSFKVKCDSETKKVKIESLKENELIIKVDGKTHKYLSTI